MKDRYKFLVLGHPRTGTGYMSKLFNYFGFDVGHEVFRKDGISNWMYGVNNIKNMPGWGTKIKRDENNFDHKFLVIRNPYTAVRSFINTENTVQKSLNYRLAYLDLNIENLNEVEVAISIYDAWIKNIRNQFPDINIIHLENAENELSEYLLNNNLDIKVMEESKPPKNYNTRNKNNRYKEVDFTNLSTKYENILKNFCKEYDYKYKS